MRIALLFRPAVSRTFVLLYRVHKNLNLQCSDCVKAVLLYRVHENLNLQCSNCVKAENAVLTILTGLADAAWL